MNMQNESLYTTIINKIDAGRNPFANRPADWEERSGQAAALYNKLRFFTPPVDVLALDAFAAIQAGAPGLGKLEKSYAQDMWIELPADKYGVDHAALVDVHAGRVEIDLFSRYGRADNRILHRGHAEFGPAVASRQLMDKPQAIKLQETFLRAARMLALHERNFVRDVNGVVTMDTAADSGSLSALKHGFKRFLAHTIA